VTTLRRLILSNNNLACLPPNIGSLVNLEYLNISNNPLIVKNGHDDYSCIPREFRQLKKLHTLIISECTLKHIPIAVWNTPSLQILDLSRNRIGYIVSDIGK
jgi:Leucine-rich repeat (LRR) protein